MKFLIIKEKNFKDKINEPKKAWKKVKKQMYGEDSQVTDRIIENNQLKIGSLNVANILNRYYVTKVRLIRENMKKPKNDPMINYKKFVKSPPRKLNIQQINMNDLRKIYSSCKNSNTISKDKISMHTLMKTKMSTQPLILNMINRTIEKGKFPECLKISRIIPIEKGGQKDLSNPGYLQTSKHSEPFVKGH